MQLPHIWLRAEQRAHEKRVGLTHAGAKTLIDAGFRLTVEASDSRAIGIDGYADAGATIAPESSWPTAPEDAIIFGLKELPEDGSPLVHRHIMFGHAFKGQFSGRDLLRRFNAGGGTLFDLEYLVDEASRRVAAFGYWAGYAGAAVTLKAWAAQQAGSICGPVGSYSDGSAMTDELRAELDATGSPRPKALVIGALGRVGSGVCDLCETVGVPVTKWDMAETAHGGPFPEVLQHEVFFNCILAQEGVPQFVPMSAITTARKLTAIGDIACDPDSAYNPVPVYKRATTWDAPVVRVHDDPVLDVMAIDNLPSMLPVESSIDFADQLLPSLLSLGDLSSGVWGRAQAEFDKHSKQV